MFFRQMHQVKLIVLFLIIFAFCIACSNSSTDTSNTIEIQPEKFDEKYACTTLLTLDWGEHNNQIGYSINDATSWLTGFHSPVFDEDGRLLIANPENNQILVFEDYVHKRTIQISENYVLKMGDQKFYWSQIAIVNKKIILQYSEFHNERIIDRLAIINSIGQVEKTISLEPYYPLRSVYKDPIKPDGYGGFFLNLDPMGLIHYDFNFHTELIHLGWDWDYGFYTLGWDKDFYRYSIQNDYLIKYEDNRSAVNLKKDQVLLVLENISEMGDLVSILGVDENGNVFILMEKDQEYFLLLIDPNNNITKHQLKRNSDSLDYFIDKQGNLYAFIYDRENSDISPRIMLCEP